MQDPFTGQFTCLCGNFLPDTAARSTLQNDHERRLAALDRLCAAAAECGVGANPNRDLVVIAEDEVSLLESAGATWAALGDAIRDFRRWLPLRRLEDFGFPPADNPLEEPNPHLHRIGGGVEAWAFASVHDRSVYKFYQPREGKSIGSEFGFRRGDEALLFAEAGLGDYRGLLQKLLLIHLLGGMATEVVAITPEGILVAKQSLGEPLPQGDDVSQRLPSGLIEIPSRFLRANRDHPRLLFAGAEAFLVADLHARNFVRCVDGQLRVIDLVAAPWPSALMARETLVAGWLERVREDPTASVLPGSRDDEL
jgi:hypothetical protein